MIERVYIHNFRCLENFSLDLSGRGSALIIGKNGAGKSTLRQALGVFQNICRRLNRVRDLVSESDFSQGRTDIPMRFEIDLTLADKPFKYAIAFEWPERFREARVAEESLSVDGNSIFTRQKEQVNLPGGSSFRLDWHVAALPVITERPGEGAIQQLNSFFSSMVLIAPIPSKMSGFTEEESFDLQHDASNFSAGLNALLLRYPAAYNLIFDYLKPVIPDLTSFENVPRGERGKQLMIRFEPEKSERSLLIDFKHLSDGEKCFFLSAFVIAISKVNRTVFCMWDEPDNHLSLPEISHFITQLRRLVNQKGQFVATSHHPETIRRFSDENTLVFHRKSHLEPTVVRMLEEIEYQGDLIDALIRNEVIG